MTTIVSVSKVDTNNSPTITFNFANINLIDISYDVGYTPNPLPQSSADDTIVIKVTGNLLTVKIGWTLKDQTSNQFSGSGVNTGVSTKTVGEQLHFIDGVFQSATIDDKHQFKIDYPNIPFIKYGILADMKFASTGNTPNSFESEFTMIIGNVVTVYELDTPSQPLNLNGSTPSAGHITISWTVPDDSGGSAITGYIVQRKQQNTDWAQVGTPSASPFADSGLTAGITYYYRVAAKNTQGTGVFSDPIAVTAT